MLHLLESIEKSLATENWEAALLVAINLPDVCAKLEGITKRGKTNRYVQWARKWVEPRYRVNNDRLANLNSIPFLPSLVLPPAALMTAEDMYALRCAYTHAGDHDLSGATIERTLSSFVISAPGKNRFHRNFATKIDFGGVKSSILQIQVDLFCKDICDAARSWLDEQKDNEEVKLRMSKMPLISPLSQFPC